MKRTPAPGFTLVELLVVMGVIVLLLALVGPVVGRTARARSLTASAQAVSDTLNLAQQTALTRDRNVEVRFYKLPDPNQNPSTSPLVDYRAMQLFIVDTTTTPIDKPLYFAVPVIISLDAVTTSLMDPAAPAEVAADKNKGDPRLPGVDYHYSYRKFVFKPSGATDLDATKSWYLTLFNKSEPIQGVNKLPANFITIQIDPQSGRTKSFQP